MRKLKAENQIADASSSLFAEPDESRSSIAGEATVYHLSAIDKALRVSEARYRRLFETAQDGILLLNAETAQIEDVNPFLVDMLGYSHEELLGKKIWEIGAFKDTALNVDAFLELQTKRYIRYDNLPLVAKDVSNCYVEFVSNVYDCRNVSMTLLHLAS